MTDTFPHRPRNGRLMSALIGGALGALLLTPFSLAQAETDVVRFGTPQWPGATVKSEVARQLLDTLGYRATLQEASPSILLESMVSGDLDINMALWRPSQSDMLDPRLEAGELIEVVKNIDGARFQLAVPEYVWDAGVHSMADLAEHAERFDRTFYGIEPGNVGNELMHKAITNDTYDLEGWRVAASSVTGMMSQVASDISNDQWIAFLGWEPHWMNVDFDIRYLEDPENLWGDASSVSSVVASDFAEHHPNVIAFLKNMVVPIAVQNQWVYAYSREEQPLETVAADWIQSHPERVNAWLEGVTTADGDTRAQDAYQASR
ncbi:ABC transporter substrate-binding protein [Chromohalobacter sp. 48-RD10]|uniref:ABC transporter substrate-binding protein n=1 Tax=Chromohalobacter sp. 48-RD10 TaxID=2994063 RepID=UPI002469C0FE|nr:ABC transporter substrate-binding protein [Chromohalobacter sp. 48-RD10]